MDGRTSAEWCPTGDHRFFSGELIDDHHSLLALIQEQLTAVPESSLNYLILDEVSYIRNWDKAVKYAADAGMLEQTILMLTGSDIAFIQEARMRFPGRRGQVAKTDFHLYPLSFKEYLTAINDTAEHGTILPRTLNTYSDWIRGDMTKRGKQEQYLREILAAIIKRYNSQVSWNSLASDLFIDHPNTVAD